MRSNFGVVMNPQASLAPLESTSALEAIERERFHSYSGVVRTLHWLAAALVAFHAVLYPESAGAIGLYSIGGYKVNAILLLLAAILPLYTFALHSQLFSRFTLEERMWGENAIDLVWVTSVILYSGILQSPFFFLYYTVIFAATPALGRRQTYVKAGIATVLVLGVLTPIGGATVMRGEWTDVPWAHLRDLVSSPLWSLTGLWLVAYFSAEAGTLGANLHKSLFLAAHTDALTGLPNLRYFTNSADLRSKFGGFYTIVMVDADRLKYVNDTFGHAVGSELIRTVGDAIRNGARSQDDLCSRIGGDEFIVRLAGAAESGALAYCRRVRAYLAEHPLQVGTAQTLPISVSMGIATYPKHGKTLSEVTDRADKALYRSKQEGRARDNVWAA
jgi:diguanylate cyclase (GGDEF)-like protein